jgi:hypothetical protein
MDPTASTLALAKSKIAFGSALAIFSGSTFSKIFDMSFFLETSTSDFSGDKWSRNLIGIVYPIKA